MMGHNDEEDEEKDDEGDDQDDKDLQIDESEQLQTG
jgi:hypothetical protein